MQLLGVSQKEELQMTLHKWKNPAHIDTRVARDIGKGQMLPGIP